MCLKSKILSNSVCELMLGSVGKLEIYLKLVIIYIYHLFQGNSEIHPSVICIF